MRQILFELGPLKFYSYGLMLGLSFAIGIYVALWRARREGISEDQIFNIAVGIVIVSLLGSKVLHILVNFSTFLENPRIIFKNFGGGFVFYGGFLASFLFIIIMNHRYKIGILRLCDIYSPSVALGLGITRVGCFLSGCCFGVPTELPWGVTFPSGSFAHKQYGELLPIHPTQLYSSLSGILIFLILLGFLKWHGKRFHGQVFSILLIFYSVNRFLIELIRGDAGRGMFWGLYTSQIIAIGTEILGIIILITQSRNKEKRLSQYIYL
ncbi:prolipoprotein diacylglyceryl transferase [candidate division CSSED10-310 bacterium]|uniref:Phosphatidylglycerol--prolipoprotein diacylglyceryl transferase n=1 Tax=candidate division CSSED10-310 bacterium TaxID=2855610 RepID=A0ABV6YZJ1_UNCC1